MKQPFPGLVRPELPLMGVLFAPLGHQMTLLDWLIVLLLNGGIIGLGMYLSRGTQSSSQWFLGARALPWWGIGLSMFATNVDNADLVGVTGNSFKEGVHIVSVYAIGSAVGGILAAFCVVPAIYRCGFYTNSEYLEARFGVTTRVLSALIQLQYRGCMLGLMTWSVYLLLTRLVNLSPTWAWILIVASVVAAGYYAAWGGLKAVVWTDAVQGLIMMAGAIVIFVAVWQAAGGWSGMKQSLDAGGTIEGVKLADLPHAGRYRGDSGLTSPYLIAIAWTIIGCGYWTVNHTQTMRLMGARSLWDMKMAAVVGVAVSMPVMLACACLGVLGRAIPEFQAMPLDEVDTLFPLMAGKYLVTGLKGLVVAAVVAAAISTFDSMGSSLSAVFTRDIYARLIIRDRDDTHYLWVSRIATVGILASGFLYLPFIMMKGNMLYAFTTLIPVFVTPLLTIYVVGVVTRAPRRSGLIGLLVGSAYGFLALIDRENAGFALFPFWLSSRWMAFLWSVLITATTMGIVTMILGRESSTAWKDFRETGWLDRSRETLPAIKEHPFENRVPIWANAGVWAVLLLVFSAWVVFDVFW